MAKVLIVVAAAVSVVVAAVILLANMNTAVTTIPVQNSEEGAKLCGGVAACIAGNVTKIIDGDTLDAAKIRVRLALVNTPEIGELGYEEAKQFTAGLCPVGSKVLIDEDDGQTEGSFGRMIAKVYCDEKILNEELARAGLAKILDRFCTISEFGKDNWAKEYGC